MGKLTFYLAILIIMFLVFRSLWTHEQEMESASQQSADIFSENVKTPIIEATDIRLLEEDRIKRMESILDKELE